MGWAGCSAGAVAGRRRLRRLFWRARRDIRPTDRRDRGRHRAARRSERGRRAARGRACKRRLVRPVGDGRGGRGGGGRRRLGGGGRRRRRRRRTRRRRRRLGDGANWDRSRFDCDRRRCPRRRRFGVCGSRRRRGGRRRDRDRVGASRRGRGRPGCGEAVFARRRMGAIDLRFSSSTSFGPPIMTRCSTLSRRTRTSWRCPSRLNASTSPRRGWRVRPPGTRNRWANTSR